MFAATVSTVGRGRRAATCHRAQVAFLRAGGVGVTVLVSLMVEGANGASWVVLFADRGSVAVALAVPAAGGFVSGVRGFDFSLAGEKEDMRAHSFAVLRGGGDHDRGGSFFRAGDRVWVQKVGRGDFNTFGVKDGGL